MASGLKYKIEKAIDRLSLDLNGLCVLTEAATGAYVVTPIIAAAAGAKVYAFTRAGRYGTVAEVRKQTHEVAKLFQNISLEVIDCLDERVLAEADVITNSNHLRPLDREKLQYLKPGAVIPAMYEKWELRDSDIDLEFCKQHNIAVAGTNELHPNIDVFHYIPELCLKLITDSGRCVTNNRFVLLCNNDFGKYIAAGLAPLCEKLGIIDLAANRKNYDGIGNIEFLSEFPDIRIPDSFIQSEGILMAVHPFQRNWLGENAQWNAAQILQMPHAMIYRISGDMDTAYADEQQISYFPSILNSGQMAILPSNLGVDPVIRLQSGSLKVAEEMIKGHFNSPYVQRIV